MVQQKPVACSILRLHSSHIVQLVLVDLILRPNRERRRRHRLAHEIVRVVASPRHSCCDSDNEVCLFGLRSDLTSSGNMTI